MSKEAKIALRLVMEYESEEAYAAGWLIDLEFILWARVLARDKSDDEVANALAWLAEEAGGWWCWKENEGLEFVPLDRWTGRFSQSRWAKDA
ncbi:MAG: hypothetical protein ACREVE_14435 [Gammaproteobacteria bacterium]